MNVARMNPDSPLACRIVIIAKAPMAGYSKTRLIPALGASGAAALAARMLKHTVRAALAAELGPVELCAAPSRNHAAWQALDLPPALHWSDQGDGDLGERMATAAQRTTARGENILLIGTDCPALDVVRLRCAAASLRQNDATLFPTADGGYSLLGLKRFHRELFDNMPWSTATVARHTLERLAHLRWSVQVHAVLHDIDEPADLQWLPEDWKPLTPETLNDAI